MSLLPSFISFHCYQITFCFNIYYLKVNNFREKYFLQENFQSILSFARINFHKESYLKYFARIKFSEFQEKK